MRLHLVATCDFLARIAKPKGETTLLKQTRAAAATISSSRFRAASRSRFTFPRPECTMFRFGEAYPRFNACSPLLVKLMAPPTRNPADVPLIYATARSLGKDPSCASSDLFPIDLVFLQVRPDPQVIYGLKCSGFLKVLFYCRPSSPLQP